MISLAELPERCEGEHDWDVTHVAGVLGRLLLLLLHSGPARVLRLLRVLLLGFIFSRVGLLVVGLVVVAEILLVLEHLVAVLALEGVVVLVPLLVSLAVGDGVEDDSAEGTPEVKLLLNNYQHYLAKN